MGYRWRRRHRRPPDGGGRRNPRVVSLAAKLRLKPAEKIELASLRVLYCGPARRGLGHLLRPFGKPASFVTIPALGDVSRGSWADSDRSRGSAGTGSTVTSLLGSLRHRRRRSERRRSR